MRKKETVKRRRRDTGPITDTQVLRVLSSARRPVGIDELEEILGRDRSGRRDIMRLLHSLMAKGRVTELKNKRFGLTREMDLLSGTLWCTRGGNAFVIPDTEGDKDVFVSSRNLNHAVHGDRVTIRLDHYRGRLEGKVIRIIERKSNVIIGFTKLSDNRLYVIPEDYRYQTEYLVSQPRRQVHDGELVVARVTAFPGEKIEPECTITKVLGDLTSVAAIGRFVEYKHSLSRRFPKHAEDEARLAVAALTQRGRADQRDLGFVTIDGKNARDFDDAVAIERGAAGFTLHVAIADVSHYVRPGSLLDQEGSKRGMSIYFPDRVLPMLPKTLSNGICSLNPLEDRYTVTVTIEFDRNGRALGASFRPSLIRSTMRLTYEAVEKAVVENDRKTRRKLEPCLAALTDMAELAGLITSTREKRGSIDFDLPEPEVVLDIKGGIRQIVRSPRLYSHRIIEEFMISANEAVARYFNAKNIPALFRVHEPPERDKLRDFERLLQGLGIGHGKTGTPRGLQDVLSSVKDTNYEFIVNRVLLRSMKQARYFPRNKGHYGLASDSYLHFTSPIRRYPDLVCHRILKGALAGRPPVYNEDELAAMAGRLSERERLVMEAERELEDRIRILYMKDRVGEVLEGVISHVTSFGFFVELSEVFVEGLVLISSLGDDYYRFEEERFRIMGRRTRKSYRVGDTVTIRVVMADVSSNRLHFEVATDAGT
ncbi:MAG: Ribonuclease R [Syntrophorhabdus sp. PtaB.Bin047]|jgi:ribonuclease R|nr:MAG: Ribonuclease R [Syntrophorhabdus sp. PtaB.Bin047]